MAKYETLNSNGDTKITIARLAKKFDMSLVDFMEAMAKYFEVTGLNPKDQVGVGSRNGKYSTLRN